MRESTPLPFPWQQGLAAIAVGTTFGVMAPFDTGAIPSFGGRLAYWLIAIPFNWLLIALASEGLRRIDRVRRWGPLRRGLLVSALASFPVCADILWLEDYFLAEHVYSLVALAEAYGSVLAVILLITIPATLIMARATEADGGEMTPPEPAFPPFFDRIPLELGRDLLALNMEDHYLRIHTTKGSDLILCRLADAIRELAGFDGMQVHRSWFVARRAVLSVARDEQKMTLTLENGLSVPVSRTYQKLFRGWGLT